jgi:uncharacterized membrane protein (UPF0127 family)
MNLIRIESKKLNRFEAMLGVIPYSQMRNVYFQTRFGIHTFGVRFPIDVLILNDDNIVISMKKKLAPFSLFIWNPAYKNVLELKEGTIVQNEIKRGDKIELSFEN